MKLKLLIISYFLSICILTFSLRAEEVNSELSFYTGTFDVIDKEGDDKTSLFGLEHKNPNLLRNTFLGQFKPVSGVFLTGQQLSIFLYRC